MLDSVIDISKTHNVSFGTSGLRALVKDLGPEVCYAFTYSFIKNVCPDATRVAIGMDLRPSSPDISSYCIAALNDLQIEVVFCGFLPTPALAYYGLVESIPCIMITGSHIPFDRNGIKFYKSSGEISKDDEQLILNGKYFFDDARGAKVNNFPVNLDALNLYIDRYRCIFPKNMLMGLKIGVYEHSSVARDSITLLLHYFGAQVVSLERTDNFVPIDTEAVSDGDKAKAKTWVSEFGLDAIISTDGDGDRPLVSDELGNWLRGDILGVLCANFLEASHVVAPVNVSSILELSKLDSFPDRLCYRTQIGSPFVIDQMNKVSSDHLVNQRIVGYEANGGLLVGSDMTVNGVILKALPTRDSFLPILILLYSSVKEGLQLSDINRKISLRFTASNRIKDVSAVFSDNLIINLKSNHDFLMTILSGLEEYIDFSSYSFNEIDGLRILFNNDTIVHFRKSGNAPELRCYVETNSEEISNYIVEKVLERVSELI